MLGVYLLFMVSVWGLPWISTWLGELFAWTIVLCLWMIYLLMFAERSIPKKYRYVIPWTIGLLSVAGGLMLIDSIPPHIGVWGRVFLSGIIFFQAMLVIGSEALLIMGSASAYLWFLIHNLVFIVGLGWFVLFSYLSQSVFSMIVLLAGAALFAGLKQWKAKQARIKNVVDASVVLLVVAGYFILLGLSTKMIILFRLDLRMFISALLGGLLALLGVSILFWDALRQRLVKIWHRFLRQDSYDYIQEWDSFVSLMEDLMDEKEIVVRLRKYFREKFSIPDAWVLWKESSGLFKRILGKETWKIPSELEKWLWYKDCPMEMQELLRNGWQLEIGKEWILVPMIFRKELVGMLLFVKTPEWKRYQEFFYMLARNLAILITIVRLSKELLEARQFEHFNKMVSFIVHDLKNSVSALELLLRNWEAKKTTPEFINDAFQTLELVVDRIKQLMARLKVYPDRKVKDSLELRWMGIKEIIETTIANMKAEVLRGVRIDIDIGDEKKVMLDPMLFTRVVENLVLNAVESIEHKEGRIDIWVEEDDRSYRLYIKDNGSGMSEEFVKDGLFKPFVSTKRDGLGIGMYEVKNIVERHNGTIEVISQEGVGTEVIIELPKESK